MSGARGRDAAVADEPAGAGAPVGTRRLRHLPVGHAPLPHRWHETARRCDRAEVLGHGWRRSTATSRLDARARRCPSRAVDAAVGVYLGVPFVMGGLDAAGKPTDTVFKGIVEDGELTGWELADGEDGTDPLTLPQPLSQAAVVAGTSGFVLIGGLDAAGAPVDGRPRRLGRRTSRAAHACWSGSRSTACRCPEPRAAAVAGSVGRLHLRHRRHGPRRARPTPSSASSSTGQGPATDASRRDRGLGRRARGSRLPEPRTRCGRPSRQRGTIYVIGGQDADGRVPDEQPVGRAGHDDGRPHRWLAASRPDRPADADRPCAGRRGGSTAFIVGGETDAGLSDGVDARRPRAAGAVLPARHRRRHAARPCRSRARSASSSAT